MIIYIHGFKSSGKAHKAKLTRDYFTDKRVDSPTLPISPKKTFSILKDLVREAGQKVYLIGSSLGGFYALMLAARYGLKVVLINPAVDAQEQLKAAIGKHTRFDSDEEFEWTEKEIRELKEIYDENFSKINPSNILLCVSTDDDVVDHKKTLQQLAKVENKIVLDNNGHQFEKYTEILPDIRKFFYGDESDK
ncbi:MAG TPA: YqiA/YcfP family alpha/beta fold hydrolase [Ignavibacteria bacterium]|nr:YqiA/YcfP family alpha/beta fold hydrolase [Ignavibacteria bacterium]